MNHIINRIIDALTDPRLPHQLPLALVRRIQTKNLIKQVQTSRKAYFALTFDVENLFGLNINSNHHFKKSVRVAKDFLTKINDAPFGENLPATFFIQGNLVQENSGSLTALQEKGNALGLHGYAHELWGKPKWFIENKPLPNPEKNRLLKRSIEQFIINGLCRPLLFRAPYLIIDLFTLHQLKLNGFKIDSSLPSFRGALPIPNISETGITRIPVSSNPVCVYKQKKIIPYCFFQQLDLANLKSMSSLKLKSFINNVLAFQKVMGFPGHLVFLSHSWEFSDWKLNNQFSYCSSSNWEHIKEKLSQIKNNLELKFVTLTELNDLLQHNQLPKPK